MTVIVALMCTDGVVLASDTQGTDLEAHAKIEVASKIFTVGTHIAWGASGPLGVQQVTNESLESAVRATWKQKSLTQLRTKIANKIAGRQREALNAYVELPNTSPPEMEALVCGYTSERWILEVTRAGLQEQHFKFCAIGSGKAHAANLWGHLRHFQPDKEPIELGKLIAYRIVHDVIVNEAVFVGGRVRIWTITEDGALELPEAEINSLGQLLTGWQAEERQSLQRFLKGQSEAPDASLDQLGAGE